MGSGDGRRRWRRYFRSFQAAAVSVHDQIGDIPSCHFETCFIPFVRRRKLFFGTYSPITSLSCGLTVVAMPKNAILSTVAAAMAAMLAAAAAFFCFEIRNGKNGIRWFAAARRASRLTDGRTKRMGQQLPVRPFGSFQCNQPTNPLFQAKNRAFY